MTFQNYASSIVEKVEVNFKPIVEVDAIEFLTSPSYLGESLFPVQRVIIKTLYSLWKKYPPDEEEQIILDTLKNEWNIEIDINREESIQFLILVLGRRSSKSTTFSFIATYEVYSLICKDNPQAYYGIRDKHPIHIMHVASAGDQAEDVFTLTKNNIRRVEFLKKYIDFDKDSSSELRLFTPFDLRVNEAIRFKNSKIPRGQGLQRETTQPGSITIESVTTSAATHRGKSIKTLLFSELAHFERAKVGGSDDDTLMSENPRTDYAIWKAFTPSVKDFKQDGRVLAESSPREKGGEFYRHYCIAGGWEQEDPSNVIPDPKYQLIQLATWQARPGFTYEDFADEFRKDPTGAAMEYGAHFGSPAGSFIQEEWIERVPQIMIPSLRTNHHSDKFVISLDPGGKAKKKKADTYAVAWGRVQGDINGNYQDESKLLYWIDGLKGFDAKYISLGGGKYQKETVDPNVVMDFVLQLIDDLGGRNFISEIVYDQFDSSAPIATLQGMGYPAIETFFTNAYKSSMYGNFLSKLSGNQVRMYGIDTEGWISRWKLEMKYLQRITSGNYTFYEHPHSGPVQNDDFADVTANLIHRLCLLSTPTKKSIEQSRRDGTYPIQVRRGPRPVLGPGLTRGKL